MSPRLSTAIPSKAPGAGGPPRSACSAQRPSAASTVHLAEEAAERRLARPVVAREAQQPQPRSPESRPPVPHGHDDPRAGRGGGRRAAVPAALFARLQPDRAGLRHAQGTPPPRRGAHAGGTGDRHRHRLGRPHHRRRPRLVRPLRRPSPARNEQPSRILIQEDCTTRTNARRSACLLYTSPSPRDS